MIEIILISFGCAAISMFMIFGIEIYIMVQKFIKLDEKSKKHHIKKAIPILIVLVVFALIITVYIFKIITEHAPY